MFKETLDKIDVRAVNRLINEGGQVIRKCVRYFKGADTIQHIAEEVQHHIDEFRPIVPLITTLKNSGMRQRHWEAISDVVGRFSYKFMLGMNVYGHSPRPQDFEW